MQEALPHHYSATAIAENESLVRLNAEGAETLQAAPPPAFGGPDNQWSPEALLMSAVSSCFVLSFRAIARASKLEWSSLECVSTGTLDKPEKAICFTRVDSHATLHVPPGTDHAKARRLLERAEQSCFVSNSLNSEMHLQTEIIESE